MYVRKKARQQQAGQIPQAGQGGHVQLSRGMQAGDDIFVQAHDDGEDGRARRGQSQGTPRRGPGGDPIRRRGGGGGRPGQQRGQDQRDQGQDHGGLPAIQKAVRQELDADGQAGAPACHPAGYGAAAQAEGRTVVQEGPGSPQTIRAGGGPYGQGGRDAHEGKGGEQQRGEQHGRRREVPQKAVGAAPAQGQAQIARRQAGQLPQEEGVEVFRPVQCQQAVLQKDFRGEEDKKIQCEQGSDPQGGEVGAGYRAHGAQALQMDGNGQDARRRPLSCSMPSGRSGDGGRGPQGHAPRRIGGQPVPSLRTAPEGELAMPYGGTRSPWCGTLPV